jgi:hypothetical protein
VNCKKPYLAVTPLADLLFNLFMIKIHEQDDKAVLKTAGVAPQPKVLTKM